jgi:hypothetical protein
MTAPATTTDLLPSEEAFLAAMQQLGFGRFECLQIRGGELVFNPEPVTVRDVKFGSPISIGKISSADGELGPQIAEIFAYVQDVDAAFKQAVGAGAKADMPPADMFWGDRYGKLTDPFGHAWGLATHVKDVSPEEMKKGAEEAFSKMQAQHG